MDLEAAKQTSRQGFAEGNAALRRMLTDLPPASRADIDQCAAAITTTLEANDLPVNADTAKAAHLATMLPLVEVYAHHPTYQDMMPCLEVHLVGPSLAMTVFLDTQLGGT